jgi:glutamyl-tRNA reductase
MGDEQRAADRWRGEAEVAAVLCALGARADAIRTQEIAQIERRLRGFTTTEREIVDTVSKALVCSLLREPTRRLNAAGAERPAYCEAIRHLFALETEDEPALPTA